MDNVIMGKNVIKSDPSDPSVPFVPVLLLRVSTEKNPLGNRRYVIS